MALHITETVTKDPSAFLHTFTASHEGKDRTVTLGRELDKPENPDLYRQTASRSLLKGFNLPETTPITFAT